MKKLFLAIALLASVASCTKDNVINQDKELIGFGGPFIENTVKATDPSYSNNDINQFNVYGTVENVVIFPGTLVEKKTAEYGSAWTCGVEQYWIPGASYKFVGIVDGNKANVTTTTLTDGMPTSVNYKADGQTDFMCQTITRTASAENNGLVGFTFSHLLSKVNFIVTNESTQAEGYSFVVKNIKISGYTQADYDVVSNAWENQVAGDISITNIEVASKALSSELATEVLVIPHDGVKVSFTVDILLNGTTISSKDYTSPSTYKLVAANAYNFNIEVAVGSKIEFTVTDQPSWTVVTPPIDIIN